MKQIDLDFTRPSDGEFFGITVNTVSDVPDAIAEAARSGYELFDITTC